MRVLLLTTDAYGGHGGIALYNRDLAQALAEMPSVEEVVVIPRTMPLPPEPMPAKVRFIAGAAGGKARYVLAALGAARGHFDVLICGHINLLPLAALLNLKLHASLVSMVYGIDVWQPPRPWTRRLLGRVDAVWSISAITKDRMNEWAGLEEHRFTVLPNAIHMERYGLDERRQDLLAKLGLSGRRVLMTLARMPSFERYKGIDEVLESMPELLCRVPDLAYLVVGGGEDQPRLQAKAIALGLGDRVVFAGRVDEASKADYFRLADVFVMPGRGEGFGFVFLEAMACGIPVVGSLLDGSREALLGGELGELANPADPASVQDCVLRALDKPRHVPPGMHFFAWPKFRERLALALHSLDSRQPPSV